MSLATSNNKRYIRLATPADFDEFANVALRAFIHDPLFNYFGTLDKLLSLDEQTDAEACSHRRALYWFLAESTYLIDGHISLVVERSEDEAKGEKFLAANIWHPPHVRMETWMLSTMLRSGILALIRGWGMNGMKRITVEYQPEVEKRMEECLKMGNCTESPEDSWHLQLAFTDPDHQGEGLMSLLLREAFANAPDKMFTLESTTPKSRDQYEHFGYKLHVPIRIGQDKADARGLSETGENAVGVTCWAMVKLPAARSVSES